MKIKSTAALLLFLPAIFILMLFSPAAHAAAPQEPKEAVSLLMEDIKNWDARSAAALFDESIPAGLSSMICDAALQPALSKLEYTLGNSKAEGKSACVDISITAVDIGSLVGDIAVEVVACVAIAKVTGLPIDVEKYIEARIAAAAEEGAFNTIRTDTSVYLVAGGDGKWKLDGSDARNLQFLYALAGKI